MPRNEPMRQNTTLGISQRLIYLLGFDPRKTQFLEGAYRPSIFAKSWNRHASIIPRVVKITYGVGVGEVVHIRKSIRGESTSRARSRCECVIHADFDDCIRGSRCTMKTRT